MDYENSQGHCQNQEHFCYMSTNEGILPYIVARLLHY